MLSIVPNRQLARPQEQGDLLSASGRQRGGLLKALQLQRLAGGLREVQIELRHLRDSGVRRESISAMASK